MSSTVGKAEESDQTVLDPAVRMKQLIELSHSISVDPKISITKYFSSGRELVKSAASLESKGDIEKAFVLYLRYMTLFLEKLVHHPEYKSADPAEKTQVRSECNRVFDLAENLKNRIKEKYAKEYDLSKLPVNDYTLQKKSIKPEGSSPRICDIDDIDRKFNFSQQPINPGEDAEFDPFNIEQLKRSFNN